MKDWNKLFAWAFLFTGIFAIVGAIFTWGEGWLFLQAHQCITLLPWADLVVTAPLSLMSAYGIWIQKKWGIVLGLMTCGVYLYGSVLVYIQVLWHDLPFEVQFLMPPLFGVGMVCGFVFWAIKYSGSMEG